MNPFLYFLVFLKASSFSMGALGNLPSLHRDLRTFGWANEAEFGQALAIGQISPGPNGLWVISLGYLTYGYLGVALALLAITLPPFLIVPLAAVYRRLEQRQWAQELIRGLALTSVGLLVTAVWSILSGPSLDWKSIAICGTASGISLTRRVGTIAILVGAAGVGYLLYGMK